MPPHPVADEANAHESRSVDELTGRNLRTILEREHAAKSAIGAGEKIAAHVASFCGSMPFIWLHVVWFGLWIFFNTSTLLAHHLDPFPFPLLAFTVSLEAIFLSAFILISQNQETRMTEQRSHLDLQINLLTEQENTQMLKMLRSIAVKVGADFEEHPDLAALEQATQPERLLEQIDQATQPAKKPQAI